MIYSTNIDDLRPDVAANCRVFLRMCADAGLNVKIVNTVRDQEKQTELYKAGTGSKLVSFHKVGVGLAFDVCDKVKGYSDISFFQKCGAIGQKLGFEWGGGWHTTDKPHFQWSENGKYNSSDIIAGKYPATMPLYKGGDKVVDTVEKAKEIIKEKTGLSDETIEFLYNYRYGDSLLLKLATAMQ